MALKLTTLGKVTVTTGGTRVALSATAQSAYGVIIQAFKANTGNIIVGDVTVNKTGPVGHSLAAGESLALNGLEKPTGLEELQLEDIYIDATVNGESATVTYIKRR